LNYISKYEYMWRLIAPHKSCWVTFQVSTTISKYTYRREKKKTLNGKN